MNLLITISDNADINQASVGASTIKVDLTGLVVNNDSELLELAQTIMTTHIARNTVGLVTPIGQVHLNILELDGVTREIAF